MVKSQLYFSKDDTTIIKGLAILFMIAHHTVIPEFYINPDPILRTRICAHFMSLMKCCVSIFTFIVGYGYFYNKGSNVSYAIKHLFNLLSRYWLVLFAISLPLVCICNRGGYSIDIQDIAYNMVGLKHGYCLGNWYVYFYIYSLLLLPCLKKLTYKHDIVVTLSIILISGISSYFIPTSNIYFQAIKECLHYTPLLVLGYLFAKRDVFCRIRFEKVRSWKLICLLLIAMLIRFAKGSVLGVSTDMVFVPMLFIFIISFRQRLHKCVVSILSVFGKNSTFIWFIHCVFFSNATKSVFQSSQFWPDNILSVFLVVTAVSLLVAMLLNYLMSKFKLSYQ